MHADPTGRALDLAALARPGTAAFGDPAWQRRVFKEKPDGWVTILRGGTS